MQWHVAEFKSYTKTTLPHADSYGWNLGYIAAACDEDSFPCLLNHKTFLLSSLFFCVLIVVYLKNFTLDLENICYPPTPSTKMTASAGREGEGRAGAGWNPSLSFALLALSLGLPYLAWT